MNNYEFPNGALLDSSEGTLRTASGDAVDLRPQTREVLRLLTANAGQPVTKDRFTETVWDRRQVGDDSLVQCIAEIRAALGDTDRRIVQTIPRKGYRFVPPVSPAGNGRRARHILIAGATVTALAGLAMIFLRPDPGPVGLPPVVAVLPLEDISAAPDRGYLDDALSEGIIAELARFPQFRVVARNSSFQFRGKPTDVREIGRVLGAGYVIEGSQQLDGARLRVTIQLVDTEDGVHLFSGQYRSDIEDLFAVQDQVVRQVASVVGQSILSELPVRAAPRDVDSRLRGLQARRLMTRLSYENWQEALALEEKSIREEPDSAWGYIGKALMLRVAATLGWLGPRDEVLAEAEQLAGTALELAPENYMSHYAMARVISRQGRYSEAIRKFRRAAELNPSDSLILIGLSVPLMYSGKTDAAIAALRQAAAVDPLHGDWLRWQLGKAYWQADDCAAGLEAMESMVAPPPPSNMTLAALLVCLDRIPEAERALKRFLDIEEHTLAMEIEALPRGWKPEGMAKRWTDDLRQAGLR